MLFVQNSTRRLSRRRCELCVYAISLLSLDLDPPEVLFGAIFSLEEELEAFFKGGPFRRLKGRGYGLFHDAVLDESGYGFRHCKFEGGHGCLCWGEKDGNLVVEEQDVTGYGRRDDGIDTL